MSILDSLVNNVGGYLRPQTAYSQVNPWSNYSAPSQGTFSQWVNQNAAPQFQQQTFNPWNQAYGNHSQSNNSYLNGNGANAYDIAKTGIMQPFQDKLQQTQDQYTNAIRQGYNSSLQSYYNSPNAFNSAAPQMNPTTTHLNPNNYAGYSNPYTLSF